MDGLSDATKSKLEKVVGVAAPLLAKALFGTAGGVVASLLANLFGISNPDDLASAIANDPDAAVKLRQLELQHADFLADIDRQNFSTEATDRQDARKYAPSNRSFLITMTFLVTAGFFTVLLLMFVPWQITEEGKQLLSMLVGMLASKWQTMIDFYFGSSHSQDAKLK